MCLIKINSYYYINLHDDPEMEAIIIPNFVDRKLKLKEVKKYAMVTQILFFQILSS